MTAKQSGTKAIPNYGAFKDIQLWQKSNARLNIFLTGKTASDKMMQKQNRSSRTCVISTQGWDITLSLLQFSLQSNVDMIDQMGEQSQRESDGGTVLL